MNTEWNKTIIQMLLDLNHAWCQFWWDFMKFMTNIVGNDEYAQEVHTVRCPKCGHEDDCSKFEDVDGG